MKKLSELINRLSHMEEHTEILVLSIIFGGATFIIINVILIAFRIYNQFKF
jgi:hypothetical protein